MTLPFVTVECGEFSISFEGVTGFLNSEDSKFAPTRDGLRAMARAFEAAGCPETVMCSSSCDFPEEDGMPKGFDARGFVGLAISLAREGLIDNMDEDWLQDHILPVVLEH